MATSEQNNLAFTLNLLNELLKAQDESENIIISPLSIQMCLALAFIGADGKTAEELSTGLRLGTLDKEEAASNFNQILSRSDINSLVKIANKIYVQNDIPLHSEFNRIAMKQFHSKAENIDFGKKEKAAQIINNWVEEQTNNKIQNLIDSSSLGSTRVLLVNAIYFKGKWENPFKVKATHKDKFWNDENNSVDVDMMHISEDFQYTELEDLDATAIQLPYQDSELYMLVIVPNNKTGLKELESKLEQIDLSKIEEDMYRVEVSLNFPKFKSEFSMSLNDVLSKMGMETMFTDNAEFGHLAEEKFRVDEVFHKAVIEVDESGTEAAAATYVKMVTCSLQVSFNKKYLTVDRPFLYFVKDKKVTYFMGRVSKF